MNDPTPIKGKGLAPVFRMAVLAGIKASVQLHMRLGGDVNATDEKGRTPLILAASRGHTEICRLLMEAGADPTRTDRDGSDAMQTALAQGHSSVAELIRSVLAESEVSWVSPPSPKIGTPNQTNGETHVTAIKEQVETLVKQDSPHVPETAVTPVWLKREDQPGSANISEAPSVRNGAASAAFETLPEARAHALTPVQSSEPSTGDSEAEEDLDLSDWVEESDAPPPLSDPVQVARADDLQRRMSKHVPVDRDEDWGDVEIDLPEILITTRRRVRLEGDEEAPVRDLLAAAVRDGRVFGAALRQIAPRDFDDPDEPDGDWIANLRLTLGDLGVIVDDHPMAPDRPREGDDEDDAAVSEVVSEALSFLRDINSTKSDLLSLYIKELPRDRLSREEEITLAMTIENGKKEALAALAFSPAAVSELLTVAEALLRGSLPLEDVIEFVDGDDLNEEGEDARSDESGGAEGREEALGRGFVLSTRFLVPIREMQELCRELARGHAGGIRERLGERLSELELSPGFIARLRRIVDSDPLGHEARRVMDVGLEKAQQARNTFAEANLKLVVWTARRFGGLTWSDRIQEGNLGLLKAIERFDHRRGARFSTYAIWWIKQSILRAVADTSRIIRLPLNAQQALRQIQRAQSSFVAQTGREATTDEISEITELPPVGIRRLMALPEEPVPLDSDDVLSLVDKISTDELDPEQRLEDAELTSSVHRQLKCLEPREAIIIRMRFGIGYDHAHTLEEVGKHYKVTRERIRQIEAKAMKKLAHPGRVKALQGLR